MCVVSVLSRDASRRLVLVVTRRSGVGCGVDVHLVYLIVNNH